MVCNNLYYQSSYEHQTWPNGNLPWWVPALKSCALLVTWSFEITWQIKTIISPMQQYLWSLGRTVTYLEGLVTLKLYNILNAWLNVFRWGHVTNQIRISPPSQYLWLQDFSRWLHMPMISHPYIFKTPQWGCHVRSLYELNTYLHL